MSTALATTNATPMSLLAVAVERGHDPQQLKQLMDLQEQWEANQARKAYAEAMHACQQSMPRIVKDRQNTHTRTSYATLEAVQRSAQPVYAQHGFSLSYGEADCPISTMKRTVCDVRHIGGHCERYHIDLPVDGSGANGGRSSMNAVQGAISTTSYAQRRLLCMIFNITLTDEDDDAQTLSVITPEQADQLKDWLDATNTSVANFLKWGGCQSLSAFPANKYDEAVEYLKRKGAK